VTLTNQYEQYTYMTEGGEKRMVYTTAARNGEVSVKQPAWLLPPIPQRMFND
jgi:hypothetical protein